MFDYVPTVCKLSKISVLENFGSYIWNIGSEYNKDFERSLILFTDIKQKGNQKIRAPWFVFQFFYVKFLAKRTQILLELLPLTSLSLLRKLAREGVDSLIDLKVLLENASISEDCVLLVVERDLQKNTRHQSGDFARADIKGTLYKNIAALWMHEKGIMLHRTMLFLLGHYVFSRQLLVETPLYIEPHKSLLDKKTPVNVKYNLITGGIIEKEMQLFSFSEIPVYLR